MRIAITGGPRTGKTTIALDLHRETGWPILHTDDTMDMQWSEASERVAKWFVPAGSLIIEGVAVPRALRKWLAANPGGSPVDRLVWMRTFHEELSPGQLAMAKGCRTVFDEISDRLEARGVEIWDGPGALTVEDLL